MLSLSYVMYFLANEFSRLSRGSLPFAFILARPFNCLGLWHVSSHVIFAARRSASPGESIDRPLPSEVLPTHIMDQHTRRRRVNRSPLMTLYPVELSFV
jgi:hypothetical protein